MSRVLFTHSYFYKLDSKQWKFKQPYPPLGSLLAAAVIRENLERTQLSDLGFVHRQSVQSYLHRKTAPYDLVILDPPYADAAIPDTLRQLSESALVQSGSVVVLGHWPRLELPDRIGTLQLLKRRCHGDSCFSILEAV